MNDNSLMYSAGGEGTSKKRLRMQNAELRKELAELRRLQVQPAADHSVSLQDLSISHPWPDQGNGYSFAADGSGVAFEQHFPHLPAPAMEEQTDHGEQPQPTPPGLVPRTPTSHVGTPCPADMPSVSSA